MARDEDDFEEERPRKPKRRNNDDFDDRPQKKSRRDDDSSEGERPRRTRRREEDLEDDLPRRRPKSKSNLPLILGIVAAILLLTCGGGVYGLYFVFNKAKDKVLETADEMQSFEKMSDIANAMDSFETAHGGFPTNSYDATGRPLLSWRVHILPFLGESVLYEQFKLDEPWDSPHNRALLNRIPRTYLPPDEEMGKTTRGTKTFYRSFSSPGSIMDPKLRKMVDNQIQIGAKINDVKDGLGATLMLIESGDAVEWTKPDDVVMIAGQLPSFGAKRKKPSNIYIVYADGRAHPVPKTVNVDHFFAAITIAGNDVTILP